MAPITTTNENKKEWVKRRKLRQNHSNTRVHYRTSAARSDIVKNVPSLVFANNLRMPAVVKLSILAIVADKSCLFSLSNPNGWTINFHSFA